MDAKKGKFLVKSFYSMRQDKVVTFPSKDIWNTLVLIKVCFFFFVRSVMGKGFDIGSAAKKKITLGDRCFLCMEKEETITKLEFNTHVHHEIHKNKLF